MGELVTYALDGAIATITMDDGKANAFSIAMLQALHRALDQAERDRAVVLLAGREGRFSAGFDLKVFAGGNVEEMIEMVRLGATLSTRVLSFATPVLGACTGHAIAAGSFLLLAADARIGVYGPFQIGLNEVRIGITMPRFVIELARQRLNSSHFDRSVVSATMYAPLDAVAAGFLDRALPAGELRDASLEAAGALAGLNPAAHAATKLRARAATIAAMREAIATEVTAEGLGVGGGAVISQPYQLISPSPRPGPDGGAIRPSWGRRESR